MRYLSYRSRIRLRNGLIGGLIAILTLGVLGVCGFFYLERYIVYTPEGAHLDFSSGGDSPPNPTFQAEKPRPIPGADLVPDTGPEESQTLTRLTGYYADGEALANPDAVRSALENLSAPTAVMLDVRSIYGNFYYTSALEGAPTSTAVNPTAVGELIQELAGNEMIYLIARLPAFRDPVFALANQSCGISLPSGALWMDSAGCYWLDPADDQVIAYLEQLARELYGLGFDEVAFDDFFVPDGAVVYYKGGTAANVTEAARRLQANLDGVKISFVTQNANLAPYAAHIYFKESDGAEVSGLVSLFAETETDTSLSEFLVFLTSSRDTRFEEYGVLKPIVSGDD